MSEDAFGYYLFRAQQLISKSHYMVVSTCDKNGKPWGSVVLYVFDKNYNFYFLSRSDTLHALNIGKNPNVSVVIFDSDSPIGVFEGVQMRGTAYKVQSDEIKKVIELYANKLFPLTKMPPTTRYKPSEYLPPSDHNFFKIEISEAYMSNPDGRISVKLR